MKVYAIHKGCKFEGGGVSEIYAAKETAIKFALMKVEAEKRSTKRIHKNDASEWEWEEVDFKSTNIVKAWQNPVDEIIIYEYEVK